MLHSFTLLASSITLNATMFKLLLDGRIASGFREARRIAELLQTAVLVEIGQNDA